jgi:hypothetical protein
LRGDESIAREAASRSLETFGFSAHGAFELCIGAVAVVLALGDVKKLSLALSGSDINPCVSPSGASPKRQAVSGSHQISYDLFKVEV